MDQEPLDLVAATKTTIMGPPPLRRSAKGRGPLSHEDRLSARRGPDDLPSANPGTDLEPGPGVVRPDFLYPVSNRIGCPTGVPQHVSSGSAEKWH